MGEREELFFFGWIGEGCGSSSQLHYMLCSVVLGGDSSDGDRDTYRVGGDGNLFSSVGVKCAWGKFGRCINRFNGSCLVYSVWNNICLAGASSVLHMACLRRRRLWIRDSSVEGRGFSYLVCADDLLSSRTSLRPWQPRWRRRCFWQSAAPDLVGLDE